MERNNVFPLPNNKKCISVLENFQRINKIIPEDQNPLTVGPHTEVLAALKLMRKNNFSQLPVVLKDQVIGVFSYRSFSQNLAKFINTPIKIETLKVDDFLEVPEYKSVQDEFKDVIDVLNNKDVVLIGNDLPPENGSNYYIRILGG